jgi:ABC-type Fe3+/spermidine/putrescine transport system ATPase subunit
MHEGALLEVGAPMELYTRPAHRITADFLGTANFIAGEVERAGNAAWDEMLLQTPVGKFAARRSVEWQPGMAAELFFRPESIELVDGKAVDAAANHGTALVERATFLGNSADVILRSGEVRLRLRAHPARIPNVGTKVNFLVPAESCIVFPV